MGGQVGAPGVRGDPGRRGEPLQQQRLRGPRRWHGDDADPVAGDPSLPDVEHPERVVAEPEGRTGARRALVEAPDTGREVAPRRGRAHDHGLLPDRGHRPGQVTQADHDGDLVTLQRAHDPPHVPRPCAGQLLLGDHDPGARVAAHLLHQAVERTGDDVVLARDALPDQVEGGAAMRAVTVAGDQDAAGAEGRAARVEGRLDGRGAGLRQPDVDTDVRGHESLLSET